MPLRMIIVGTGGFGGSWCRHFLPPNVKEGLVDVVAAVDSNPAALENAREGLGLPASRCYTEAKRAFAENKAEACIIVVPPAFHESIVDGALSHGLHILSEKPISDTLEASCRIARKVRAAGVKMGVTMSHRFDQDKSTLRAAIRSGAFGSLDYLVCRFTCDARKFGTWGNFRHEIVDPLLWEGAVHHLDLLADMAGAPAETIYAQTWNPKWGEYAGDSQALVTIRCDNGVRVSYEGASCNAVGLNQWSEEYVRAECEQGTLIMSNREIRKFPYVAGSSWRAQRETDGEPVTLLSQPKWTNTWLIEKFARWVDGGPEMETAVEANLQSVAMVSAAIESSRTGRSVNVQQHLAAARKAVQRA